jgi:hypothetical protein
MFLRNSVLWRSNHLILSPEKSALWKFSVSERMEAEGALGWELRSSALRVNPLPMKFISSFYAGDNKMASETPMTIWLHFPAIFLSWIGIRYCLESHFKSIQL